jgi:glycine betaine/choline ABC-type transport system substrate-binding protein
MMNPGSKRGKLFFFTALFFLFLAWVGHSQIRACVGRTIYIGYYEGEPEQKIMSTLLTIFVDERTGTSVKTVELKDRKQGFDFLKRNKVSILVEYPGKILEHCAVGENSSVDAAEFDSRRLGIGAQLKAVFVTVPGFDNRAAGSREGRYLGKAYIILSKKALSVFPAMPRLLKKLAGKVDNSAMSLFLNNIDDGPPEKGTRRFLKKNKLI